MTRNIIDTTKPIPISSGGTSTNAFSTQYGAVYNNSGVLATTNVGATGQILASNGGGAPSFQTISGGSGNFVLLQTQVATNASSVSFISQISSSYQTYYLTWSSIVFSTAGAGLNGLLSTNNGSSWVSTTYATNVWSIIYNIATIANQNYSVFFNLGGGDTVKPSFGTAWFFNMGVSAYPVIISTEMSSYSPGPYWVKSVSEQQTLGVYNAIYVYPNAGTISGTISLYGVKQ